jgi:hypothetical protein
MVSAQMGANGRKGPDRIITEVLEGSRDGVHVRTTKQQRVAVRTGRGDRFGPELAATAREILDDDVLSQSGGQGLCNNAGGDIGWSASRERDNNLDRPFGESLRSTCSGE